MHPITTHQPENNEKYDNQNQDGSKKPETLQAKMQPTLID